MPHSTPVVLHLLPQQPRVPLRRQVEQLLPDGRRLHVGHNPRPPARLVNQLGEDEEGLVHVDVLVRRRLHHGDRERLELLLVDEALQLADEDLVGLVALGGRDHQRLADLARYQVDHLGADVDLEQEK